MPIVGPAPYAVSLHDLAVAQGFDPASPSVDWSEVVEKSIELSGDPVIGAPIGVGAPPLRVHVPPGRHTFSRPWNFVRPLHLHGEGDASVLAFEPGVTGLIFPLATVLGVPGAAGSLVERLHVTADGGAPATKSGTIGLLVHTMITVRYLYVTGFYVGVSVEAGYNWTPKSIANLCYFEHVWVYSCKHHGFYLDGPDANQCVFQACNASDNGYVDADGVGQGWGFYDSSFLGNYYAACHTSSNKGGSYRCEDPNAKSIYLGCYAELDQPAADVVPPSIIIGGIMTITPRTTGLLSMAGGMLSAADFAVRMTENYVRLGGSSVGNLIQFGCDHPQHYSYFRLRKDPVIYGAATSNGGWWGINFAGLNGGTSIAWCDYQAPEYGWGSSGYSKLWAPNGLIVGIAGDRQWKTTGAGPPTVPGHYPVGMWIDNTRPAKGKPTHWICVEESSDAKPTGVWLAGPLYP